MRDEKNKKRRDGRIRDKFLKDEELRQELLDKPFELVVEYYIKIVNDHEELQEDSEKKIAEKDLLIGKLKKELENCRRKPRNRYEGYNKRWDGVDKIKFIVERSRRALAFWEIKEILLELEPELCERWTNVDMGVSHLLFRCCDYGVLTKSKKHGNKGRYIYSISLQLK